MAKGGLEKHGVDFRIVLPHKRAQPLRVCLRHTAQQVDALTLRFQHVLGDAISLQHLFDQALHGQGLAGLKHVAAEVLFGDAARQLFEQVTHHLVTLRALQIQFRRNVGQQQFVIGIVVEQRRQQGIAGPAGPALDAIQLAGKQGLFQMRLPPDVNDLLHVGLDQGLAGRAGNGHARWHHVSSAESMDLRMSRGSVKWKVAPLPGRLSTPIDPPCASTMARAR